MKSKTKQQEIIQKLNKIGLNRDQSRLYIELWTKGPKTVVQLSRHLSLGRNVIYRLLEELENKNLISKKERSKGAIFEALNYKNLKLIVDKRREKFEKSKNTLAELFEEFTTLKSASKVSSNVIHYHGIEGLKQVNWNLVDTKGMYRVYEVTRLSNYLDEKFAERLRNEWLRRKIHSRDLTNEKKVKTYTNIIEFMEKYSEYRHIDPEVLKIDTEVYIYNDVVTVLQYDALKYDPKSIFCVEIHNQALASMQKQIYDVLWDIAKPIEITDR